MSPERKRIAFGLAASLTLGCVDLGYRAAPFSTFDADVSDPGDAGETAGEAAEGGSCIEGPAAPATTGPQVHFVTLAVDTPLLAVTSGDVVTWTNTDTMRHTVTAGAPGAEQPAASGGFTSGEIAPTTQWAYRFCNARTVIYFCATHPNQMRDYRIVVSP